MDCYLGIDFGTSGARGIVIDEAESIVAETKENYSINEDNLAQIWQNTLVNLIISIPLEIRSKIRAIALNGTSSTVLLCDHQGKPLDEPILYNDSRAKYLLPQLTEIAPENSITLSATSSLIKLLYWQEKSLFSQAQYFLHQADWLSFLLHGKLGISDYHNALKLGYDVEKLAYPNWLQKLPVSRVFPQVVAPGTILGQITPEMGDRLKLSPECLICAGTTDSIAAFIASKATQAGEAVTSLGSTLVLKLLSQNRIENNKYGIYSHRFQLPNSKNILWLTGGASNTGGAVLKHFFSEQELDNLSSQINPSHPTNLAYYPLIKPGERFPINDPQLLPQIAPIPHDKKEFLQGLLEGIAKIESKGYHLLKKLGATPPKKIYTAGGGAKNKKWAIIRQKLLQIPVVSSPYTEAAYGSALLAKLSIDFLHQVRDSVKREKI
jgi:sugar (pentulose or hexulose) kinase